MELCSDKKRYILSFREKTKVILQQENNSKTFWNLYQLSKSFETLEKFSQLDSQLKKDLPQMKNDIITKMEAIKL